MCDKWEAEGGENVVIDGIKRPLYKDVVNGVERIHNPSLPWNYPNIQTIEAAGQWSEMHMAMLASVGKQWEDDPGLQSTRAAIRSGSEAAFWAKQRIEPYRKYRKQVKKAHKLKAMLEEYRQHEKDIQDIEKIEGYLKEIEDKIIHEQGVDVKENNPEKLLFKNDRFFRFELHFPYLKEMGYITKKDDFLLWEKGGQIMLAAYFGMLQEKNDRTKNRQWAPIEKVFKVYIDGEITQARNLAAQYKDFEEIKKCISSKHDKEIQELTRLIDGKKI
jgi:hypothetical protein